MYILTKQIEEILRYNNINKIFKKNENIFPFNSIEVIFCFLISEKIISFNNYIKLRSEYIERNKNLDLYNLSSKKFGVTWAQNHILAMSSDFKKPSKVLDSNFKSNYDLYYLPKNKRIEVKAARLIEITEKDNKTLTSIASRAMSFNEAGNSSRTFWINYQQIYFGLSDITIFILVCVDTIKYLVYDSKDLEENEFMKDFQHRGNKNEGQLWINNENFQYFKNFIIEANCLVERVSSL